MRKPNLEYCKQGRVDCVCRNTDGECVALQDTNFTRKDGTRYECPFYKSIHEVLNENH